MWGNRALPGFCANDVGRTRKHEADVRPLRPRGERAAGVIEVQVGEHHHIDVVGGEPDRGERREQDVVRLDDPVALAQAWLEERADAGLEQDGAPAVAHDQTATRERDPVDLVRRYPLLPHSLWRIAKHRTAIETLRVS